MTVRRRNDAALAVAVVVVSALLAGTVVLVFSRGHSGPPHPSEWDPRVLDIVHFDEQHRGLQFKQPVFVDFLDAKAYSDRARTDQSKLTDDEKKRLEAQSGELRALGLSNSNIDLLQAANDLQDTGTLAFYDPDTERITVRGTDMSVALRVTLAHELTHVLQDQNFGVGRRRTSQFTTSQQDSAFRALVEGDAVRIENEYIDSLSDADKQEYESTHNKEVDNAVAGLSNVPVALQALQSAPYLLGPPFDEWLVAVGLRLKLDAAFKDPPSTDEHLLDPPTYLHKESPLDVDEPTLPDGVSKDAKVDSGDFGALTLLLMLGERTDPIAALHAVDGWGGDAFVAYTQNGKTCMQLAVRGDSAGDTTELRDALVQWAAAMPSGAATVGSSTDVVHVVTCDPGIDSGLTLNNRGNDLVQLPATRSEFMFQAVSKLALDDDKAFEFGDCVVRTLGFDTFVEVDKAGGSALSPDLQQTIQNAVVQCRTQAGR